MKKLMLTLLGLGAIFVAEAYETSDVDYGQATSSPTLDLIWEFDTVIYNSKTCAKITGVKNSGGDTVSGDISVPQTLVYSNQSYIVKKIAAGAFANQIGISSITIPLTVEDIETPFCPGCTLLSSITVDAASPWFASVDGLLFDKDKEVLIACPPTLDTISLPSTLLEIGDEAFAGCFRFKTLEMPAGVENIGSRAFANCKRLKSLTFRGNAPGVGTDVFSGSTPTLTIYIPEGNTTFGSVPGTWQGQNLNYSTGGQITGVTSAVSGYVEWWFRVVDGQAELYNNGQSCIKTSISSTSTLDAESSKEVADGELRIPSTLGGYPVTKIGDNAFRNCSALVTVVIPDSITSIGDTAFKNCTGINSLTLPGNMKSIGSHAFEGTSMTSLALPDSLRVLDGNPMAGCDTMLTVTIAADNSYYTVINGLLYDKDVNLLVGCPARKENAPLAATCTAIGSEAFYGCFRLNNISLPEHLTSVGENAFYAMPRLASLVFPKSVTTLEGAALFNGCTALAFIGFSGNAPAHDADLLLGTPSTTKIYVDNGTKGWDGDPDSTALPSSGKWPEGSNGRPIENFSVTPAADLKEGDIFTLINTNGTMYAWTLKVLANRGVEILAISPKPTGTFSVPESFDSSIGTLTVKSVGSRLLANATGLLKATFPNTVTNIGDEVFANCDVLAEVTLAYGLRSIGRNVFAGSAIETITLPDTVQSIAGNILAGCNPSTAVAVGASNPSFAVSAEGALYDKDFTTLFAVPMLTEEIAIPATVTAFAEECFLDCLRLKKVTFAGNAPTAADGDKLYLDAHASLTNYVAESSTGFGTVPGTWHLRPVVYSGSTPAEEGTYTEEIAGIKWTFKIENGVAIVRQAEQSTSGDVEVPDTLKGTPVTTLYHYSFLSIFSNPDKITGVTIPSTVTNMGDSTFYYCSSLAFADLSAANKLEYIGDQAFDGCSLLTTLEIPDSCLNIGDSAFSGCNSLVDVILPGKMTSLGSSAFSGCSMLQSVTMPTNLTGIARSTFSGCSALKAITLPADLKTIAQYAFENCSSIKSITIPNTVTTLGAYSFNGCSSLAEVTFEGGIPSGLKNSHLLDKATNVNCPEPLYDTYKNWLTENGYSCTVNNIGEPESELKTDGTWYYHVIDDSYAELWCTNGAGDNVCALVNPQTVGTLTLPTTLGGYIVKGVAPLALSNLRGITAITIPSTYESIGDFACSNCTSLAGIEIPYGVRSIGKRAFMNTIVTDLTIPDSVINLNGNIAAGALFDLGNALEDSSHFLVTEDGAVYNRDQTRLYACPTRTEGTLVLPDSLTDIGKDAFFGCFRITYLNLPESVTNIEDNAFNVSGIWPSLTAPESDAKLTKVFYNCPNEPSATETIYNGTPEKLVSYIPSSWILEGTKWKSRPFQVIDGDTKPVLQTTDPAGITWYYRIKDGYAEIYNNGKAAAESDNAITGLTLPTTLGKYLVKGIGNGALANQRGITAITIPATYESIGDYAFSNCTSLSSITIPNGIVTIGKSPFYGTTLSTLSLPASTTEIDGNPGHGAGQLRAFSVDANNPRYTAENGLLYDKAKTTLLACPATAAEITLPETVESLADDAFRSCSYLVTVNVSGDEPVADETVFADTPNTMTTKADAYATAWTDPEAGVWKNRPFVNLSKDKDGVSTLTDDNGTTWTYTIEGAKLTLGDYGSTPVIPNTTAGAIVIPEKLSNRTVTEIPEKAFVDCGLLTKITIPAGVTNIAADAFNGCTSLVEIAVASDNSAFKSKYRCLYSKDGKTLVRVPAETRFAASQSLTSTTQKKDIINILGEIDVNTGLLKPNTIIVNKSYDKSTETTNYAFTPAISTETLFDGVTEIADYAFTDCGRISEGSFVSGALTVKKNGKPDSSVKGTFALPFSTDAEPRTKSTNTLSRAAGFYKNKVCNYETAAFITTTRVTDVPIVIPTSVISISKYAFEGAYFTNISKSTVTGPSPAAALVRLDGTASYIGPLTPGVSALLDLSKYTGYSASGLPDGLKWSKTSGQISGIPTKSGTYTVTFKLTKKKNGKTKTTTYTETIRIADYPVMTISANLANPTTGSDTTLVAGQKLTFYVGVQQNIVLSVGDGLDGTINSITAQKLPDGLKLVKTALKNNKKAITNYLYSISGIPTQAQKKKTSTIKVSNKYNWSGTLKFKIEVLPLPAWVTGDYNGIRFDTSSNAYGIATASVTSTGKLSGKCRIPSNDLKKGKSYSFSADSLTAFDVDTGSFSGSATMKIGHNTYILPFSITENDDGTGILNVALKDGEMELVQNIWNRNDLRAPSYNKGSKVKINGITYKFASKGIVSWSGKVIGDNNEKISVSGTSQLLNDTILLLYIPPKSNLLGGICEIVDFNLSW